MICCQTGFITVPQGGTDACCNGVGVAAKLYPAYLNIQTAREEFIKTLQGLNIIHFFSTVSFGLNDRQRMRESIIPFTVKGLASLRGTGDD